MVVSEHNRIFFKEFEKTLLYSKEHWGD